MIEIPGYRLTEQIHAGARTIVYRGIQEKQHHVSKITTDKNSPRNDPKSTRPELSPEKSVIIKTAVSRSPRLQELTRLRHEYERGKLFSHDHIITYLDLVESSRGPAVIEEDFQARSLKELTPTGGFNLETFLNIALAISKGLEEIHRLNIIHLDIKPGNLVMNPESGDLKVIDFGASSSLRLNHKQTAHPGSLEGTLEYISPEQTGRMNRSLDYRSDFYSLGITFFYLLTGRPPFQSEDPMELIHCHIARNPPALREIRSELPEMPALLIERLTAKNAEDRYQSARSLRLDLKECLRLLKDSSALPSFPPGRFESRDRFSIPQKLYGREQERGILLEAFDRVNHKGEDPGRMEILLLAGYSGVGKSSLVYEIHKPLTERRGHFVAGKFDQFRRNIPYSAIAGALSQFFDHLLGESEEVLEAWKNKILAEVGEQGEILTRTLPGLEKIIGPQPSLPAAGLQESITRFNAVFQRLIRSISRSEHPLIIFLDDLQWADPPSLSLLETLAKAPSISNTLLLGAYRDNEVDRSHPLAIALGEIQNHRGPVQTIVLGPLTRRDLRGLVDDTLGQNSLRNEELAGLIYDKTRGNAFFAGEFFKSLYAEGLLRHHNDEGWSWDRREIVARQISDNVVDLLLKKIDALPHNTRKVLGLAACVGAEFELRIISLIFEKKPGQTMDALWPALESELIVPLDQNFKNIPPDEELAESYLCRFKFQHDRVRQAAGARLEERAGTHLKIARLLYRELKESEREKRLFDLAEQFKNGVEKIQNPRERIFAAGLFRDTAARAMDSAAFEVALDYLELALELLPRDPWLNHYDLSADVYRLKSECEFLNGNITPAIKLLDTLIQKTEETSARLSLLKLKSSFYTGMRDTRRARETYSTAFLELGISIQAKDKDYRAALQAGIEANPRLLDSRVVESVINLPELRDPRDVLMVDLTAGAFLPLFQELREDIGNWLVFLAVKLSLEKGNTPNSSYVYILFGAIVSRLSENFQIAYQYGIAALDLIERTPPDANHCRLLFWQSIQLNHFGASIRDSFKRLRRSYEIGRDSGEYIYAGYAAANAAYFCFLSGEPVEIVRATFEELREMGRRVHYVDDRILLDHFDACLLALEGETTSLTSLDHENFDEKKHLAWADQDLEILHLWFNPLKLTLLMVAGDYSGAVRYAREYRHIQDMMPSYYYHSCFYFYYTLALLCMNDVDESGAEPPEPIQDREDIKDVLEKFERYSRSCPENFEHQLFFLQAEYHRTRGDRERALRFYIDAIHSARRGRFLQNEALACERLAAFWESEGFEEYARKHLEDAYQAYMRWGAVRKTTELEARHPWLPGSWERDNVLLAGGETSSSGLVASGLLDYNTVTKATRAISSEIDLNTLLERMMTILLENAGARRGFFILESGGELRIEAAGKLEFTELPAMALKDYKDAPAHIILRVWRSQKSLVIHNVQENPQLCRDPYVIKEKPRSILCMPVLRKERKLGILFLDNDLTAGAFTAQRIEVLNTLMAQAAISIENSRLYENLEELVQARTRELEQTHKKLLKTAHKAGMAEVASNVLHNVGNVLNSTGVPAQLLMEELETSRYSSLYKVVELLETHADNPVEFFTRDKRGQKLPAFLRELAAILEKENLDLKHNTGRILDNIEHLKEIIRVQKSLAEGGGFEEALRLVDIVEDALRLQAKDLDLAKIRIVKDVAELPPIVSSRHKILLVLTNLLTNAREATLTAAPPGDMTRECIISITIQRRDERRLEIRVADQGEGIPAENLTKIFQHGFSTRPNANGFGLHTGAIAAGEIGGDLKAFSDGPGKGAVFVLDLPFRTALTPPHSTPDFSPERPTPPPSDP